MGYFYKQRVLAVPVKGFEDDYKKFKETLENCIENEDFSKIESAMDLGSYDAEIDTSEDVFVEATDEYCQFFIYSSWASEGFTVDTFSDLASTYNVCVYHSYCEEDDCHDGAGVGITYITKDEDGEVMSDYAFRNCSELQIETMLNRISTLSWDYGYDDEDDPDYHYESSSDALACFKKILSDLGLVTENPEL